MLRDLLRQLTHHPLYTAINLIGLSFGIAVFLTMALIVRYETGYDRNIPDADTLYRVDTLWRMPGQEPREDANASFVAAPFMREDFAGITAMLRTVSNDDIISANGHLANEHVTFSDSNLLTFFPQVVLDGDPKTALAAPNRVAIPASIARKYFGRIHAVGRTMLSISNHTTYSVTLVFADPPLNSSMNLGIVMRFPSQEDSVDWYVFHHWGGMNGTLWLRIPDRRALPIMVAGMRHYMTRHPGSFTKTQVLQIFGDGGLLPIALPRIHFHDASIGLGGTSATLVHILELIGFAALVTSAINYVNLATARASLRAREVAIHKVMGATQTMLLIRFLIEALALVAIASLGGLSLCEIATHYVDANSGWHITADMDFCVPIVFIIVLITSIGAGLYPALVLARFKPASVLSASHQSSGGRMSAHLRQSLVVLQFAFAMTLSICTAVTVRQANFIQNMTRGYKHDGIIILGSSRDPSLRHRQETLVAQFSILPGVTRVERSDLYPHRSGIGEYVAIGGRPGTTLQWVNATPGYRALYGIRLLAGRWFEPKYAQDFPQGPGAQTTRNIVITRTGANLLGFTEPQAALGAIVTDTNFDSPQRIVGVTEDLRFGTAHDAPRAWLFRGIRTDSESSTGVTLQIGFRGMGEAEMIRKLEARWRDLAPDIPFDATPISALLASDARTEHQHGQLFAIGSGVAIAIATLGLYGLSLFTVSRRRHEIGIRKVLGARTSDVLRLQVVQFLRPVLLANLIAWPLAWVLMARWLSDFDQHIALTPFPFIEVATTSLLIGTATVLAQIWRAARVPPADAIRS